MKKVFLLCAVLCTVSINSCKKDLDPLDKPGNKINPDEANATIYAEEVMDWFDHVPSIYKPATQLLQYSKQAVIDGKPVVRIPVATNAALYFTKENGLLQTFAYKWMPLKADEKIFTGNIDVYNFQTQNLQRLTYDNGKLKGIGHLLSPKEEVELLTAASNKSIKTFLWIPILSEIWCWITGGHVEPSSYVGLNPSCEHYDNDDTWGTPGNGGFNFGDYTDLGYAIMPGSWGDGGTGGNGGGTAWGPPPCAPIGQGTNSTTKLKVNGNTGNECSVDHSGQWMSYSIIDYSDMDTFSGDDTDEPANDDYGTDNGPTAYIPSRIILNNGKTVSVLFGSTNDGSASQPVSVRLINLLKQALNLASQNVTINSIYIKASTNGGHGPNSNHYSGHAIDISRINGIPMVVSGSSNEVIRLQLAFDQSTNIRENFGPYFLHKLGQPHVVPSHNDHIHISVNKN